MRLLNVHTYELQEFFGAFGKDIPPYAILSHTWGNEEVTFADLPTPEARLKEGWKKIEYTCKDAKRRNLDYVWVDTCCIDKSSSSELSEAINSMFLWYKKQRLAMPILSMSTAQNSSPNLLSRGGLLVVGLCKSYLPHVRYGSLIEIGRYWGPGTTSRISYRSVRTSMCRH